MKDNILVYDTPEWLLAFTTGRDASVEDLGLGMEELGLPRQTHSDHVLWVNQAGRPEDTDAVITSKPDLCLCVKTADCIPVLVYDSQERIIAAIHAGWRGTVARIVSKAIGKMQSRPENLHAIIGPGISLQAFEVGNEVYDAFHEAGFPMQRIARKSTCGKPTAGCWKRMGFMTSMWRDFAHIIIPTNSIVPDVKPSTRDETLTE